MVTGESEVHDSGSVHYEMLVSDGTIMLPLHLLPSAAPLRRMRHDGQHALIALDDFEVKRWTSDHETSLCIYAKMRTWCTSCGG